MTCVEKTMERLLAIHWEEEPRESTPKVLEWAHAYLRSFAGFVFEYHSDHLESLTPFASPSRVLGITESPLNNHLVSQCESLVAKSSNAYDGAYAKNALEWAALCDLSHSAIRGREDLFEPLLQVLGSRTPAMIRKGFWVVGENMFPLQNWVARYTSQLDIDRGEPM